MFICSLICDKQTKQYKENVSLFQMLKIHYTTWTELPYFKLDLTQSFHEIELEESSRYITICVCPKGFYRYKRLMFGINSAPELHQRIIQQTIQYIPWCKNVVDDIIVYVKNQQDHDKTLHALLSRFCQKLFTLNRKQMRIQQVRTEIHGAYIVERWSETGW